MAEDPPKKVETPDVHKEVKAKGGEQNKISETVKEPDQTAKFRELRRELAKQDAGFSFSGMKVPASGSKFELTDDGKPVAAATHKGRGEKPTGTLEKPPTAPEKPTSAEKPPATDTKPAAVTPPAKPLDMAELTRDAEAIRKATGNDNYIARWADKEAINKILEGKTDAERKAIDQIYQKDHGRGLEAEMRAFESGSDLDKFLNVLNRKDGNAENQAARRIHENLLEKHNLIDGRSSSEIEKDVRDLLSTRNSDQISKMDDEYKKTYGVSLKDAINNDAKISQTTKEMAAVYLKGNDKRTDQDTAQLISTSLKNQNSELFAESMRDASPAARKAFLDNGGEQKVNDAFGHWYSNKDVQHAMDYAKEGKLSASTQIRDNTGLVFDNAKGVELAITRMTDGERKMYVDGKALTDGKTVAGLSPDDQKKSREYFGTMHDALSKTANATEMVKYEDMIAAKGDGSFVSSLAKDRGWIYNTSTADMIGEMRNMTPAQFDDAQKHPERRAELQKMLSSLNKNEAETKEALGVYDKMMTAKTVEDAREVTKPSVQSAIAAGEHWYGNDSEKVLTSISQMSKAEQEKYKTNEPFRNELNQSIDKSLQNPRELDAAHRMLQAIKDGKDPNSDVIARMERSANGSKTDEMARDIEKAFKDDPTLRDRVINPKTDEDRKYSQLFKKTAQESFGEDYENFGKPLAEQGRLPLEWKVGLNQGVFSNDYKQAFEDLQQATPEEKKRLKEDPQYRQTVLGFMDANRQQIALATINQTELKPEDNIRAAVVGWGGSADIVDELKRMKPEDLDKAKSDYATKYGSSLEGDLMHKLSGTDRDAAERVLTQNLNVEERASIQRNQTENARSGFGAYMQDNVFRSGTGAQADDAQLQTNRALSEQNKMDAAIASGNAILNKMTPDQIRETQAKITAQISEAMQAQATATDNHIESKKAAGEYVGDAAIIGSLILTGGSDAPLVIGLAAAAGATIKVGANAAFSGNNYDFSVGNVATDTAMGAITAGTAGIGAEGIAAVFGIGKVAAVNGAKLAIAETGEQLLATGGREALETGTQDIVRNALASGAKKLNQEEFTALAAKSVSPELTGAARDVAVNQLATSLEKNVSEQIATGVVRHATRLGLNAGAGAAAGGAGGIVQGTSEWDSRNSVAQNLERIAERTGESALSGAVVAGLASEAMPVIQKILPKRGVVEAESKSPLQPSEHPGVNPGEQIPPGSERPVTKPLEERPAAPEQASEQNNARAADQKWPRNEKGQVLDSKGNVIENDWPKVPQEHVEAVRTQVRLELGQVKAADGQSVLEKLDNSGLTAEQKTRVADALGEVREHYAKTFASDPDQPVNWIHTQGELGRVIDAAKAAQATPSETEDALLASMFSDSLKTKANFTTHHLDGELAAEHVLKDKLGGDFTPERLNGIMHAIREHQIAPPEFMGGIYKGIITRGLGHELSPEETKTLNSLVAKMNDPFHQTLVEAPGGGKMLALNEEERSMLALTGSDQWHVPSDGNAWNKISRALIDGDGIDNYATPGGLSKIVQIRGPETAMYFKDGNFRYDNPGTEMSPFPSSSQGSWRKSFRDFTTVASPDGLKVANEAVGDAETAAVKAQSRVDAWLHQRLNIPASEELPVIPGWTGKPQLDAAGHPMTNAGGRTMMIPDNLKYPNVEQKWWDINNTPLAKRSAENQAWYEDPANRYRGLDEKEIQQFKLAKEIRDQYAGELRKEQRVGGDAAPIYEPVP